MDPKYKQLPKEDDDVPAPYNGEVSTPEYHIDPKEYGTFGNRANGRAAERMSEVDSEENQNVPNLEDNL